MLESTKNTVYIPQINHRGGKNEQIRTEVDIVEVTGEHW